jgi:hypothetical protein
MGTSFVEYKGFGFWTRDNFLESWLTTLLEEMKKLPSLEPWQEAMKEHWRIQAIIDGGAMSVDLDDFLTDSDRKDFVLSLAKGALKCSAPIGRRTGELFIDLLAGKLKTTVSSPIDYLNESGTSQARPG